VRPGLQRVQIDPDPPDRQYVVHHHSTSSISHKHRPQHQQHIGSKSAAHR
jgi:hypothetical protein